MVSKDGIHTLRIATFLKPLVVNQAVKVPHVPLLSKSLEHAPETMKNELVGLDCNYSYLPHRVAMQFGMDQDLPGVSVRCLINWWKDCMQADSQRCIGENFKARNKFREDRSFTIGSDNMPEEQLPPFFCTESEELQEANTACVQKSFVFFLQKTCKFWTTILRTDEVESRPS
ncbi:hypothetical protein OIU78_017674 [Salix suchowensis]|nr:hypothetical protein OIU78_017674 [Salix suchowensis]